MCGIAGLFLSSRFDSIHRMVAALHHRGPDDKGVFVDETCALGQARLSIIDTSPSGHQPMAAADGLIQIVYNGEAYNYREERELLIAKGYRFRSETDTEVVLKLYEEYGESFLTRLRGIFALAIYDRRRGPGRERLLLARDQFGIKPLLYAHTKDGWVFASELKSLLAGGLVSRNVNSDALRQLLSLGSIYQPATLVQDVFAVPPAHMILIDRNGSTMRRYWSYGLDRVAGLRRAPYPEQVERFAEALTESVRLQMVADVPVGAFLSGGVDSSLIVALMARIAGGRVKTFSVGFEDGADAADESGEAEVVARLLGTDHSRVLVGAADMAAHLDRFILGLDQPSVDGLNSYFVSQAAARGVTVSLSGTGGDELFLGYPWFAAVGAAAAGIAPPRPRSLIDRFVRPLLGRGRGGSGRGGDDAFLEAFGRQYHCFGPQGGWDALATGRRDDLSIRSFTEEFVGNDELADADPMERAGVLCLNGYTRNQLLRDIDACSMAHSLEVRVPFLDVKIADFAFSLPVSSKLALNERTLDPTASYAESGVKRVVCDVARRFLPPEFFSERAKRGFSLPYGDWLRGPLAEVLADTLSPRSVADGGLFNPTAAAKIRQDFLDGRRPWSHPWLLMVTELWRRNVLQA